MYIFVLNIFSGELDQAVDTLAENEDLSLLKVGIGRRFEAERRPESYIYIYYTICFIQLSEC
jgi:hypothetical protein